MAEFTDLEQVWLVVSPHNPLKMHQSLLQDYHRLQLVKTAIRDSRKLKASDVEFKLSKPSYTINTLSHLGEQFPEHVFALIIGADILETFQEWKDYEQILQRYTLYVYPRLNHSGGELMKHPNIKFVQAPLMEISSTFIRESIRKKKDIRYMMPESVWDYIEEMHFYEK
jgi:nicotinate-nucleotide adenylyltransferase